MNFTQKTLILAGFLASATAFSAPDAADFQTAKAAHIANIQARLQVVQKHLACAEAAQDKAAIKACHETAKGEQKALTEKMKSQHQEMKAQREAKKPAPAAAPAKK